MKVKIIFRWYDFWIGLFYDRKESALYFFPIPMLGMKLEFPYHNPNWKPVDAVSWHCRFHPFNSWHEVGCPHRNWTKEELQSALETKKSFEVMRQKGQESSQ